MLSQQSSSMVPFLQAVAELSGETWLFGFTKSPFFGSKIQFADGVHLSHSCGSTAGGPVDLENPFRPRGRSLDTWTCSKIFILSTWPISIHISIQPTVSPNNSPVVYPGPELLTGEPPSSLPRKPTRTAHINECCSSWRTSNVWFAWNSRNGVARKKRDVKWPT